MRRSFERQVPLFSGPDSPFARRGNSSLSWIEPLAESMIVLDVGARRLRDSGIENVLLQEANVEALPFIDESFDIVFCRSSLHHFADPARAVAEMTRVCRIGGRIVLVDLVAPDPEARERFDDLHRLLDPSHVRVFTERELADVLPGGIDDLVFADTSTIRLPIDVAFSEQSDRGRVVELLAADAAGEGESTGFDPVEQDGTFVVSFVTGVVQTERR